MDITTPIPVEGPDTSRIKFYLRQVVDLQLKTVASCLCPLLATLSGNVLDIGAGRSPWRSIFNASVNYQGVDIRSADQFGMGTQENIVYYDGSILPFPDASFDAAICIEVLEHVVEPQLLLREAYRILRPGAIFTLTVPWSARVHHIPFDFHRFTRYKLDRMLCEAGFVDVEIQARGNDICAVANKLIVICWRLVVPKKRIYLLWTLPLAILNAGPAAVALICAHLSLLLNLGSQDDPLGYFLKCKTAPLADA